MNNILNITNGDCAVDVMKRAKISGKYLPWRDVLHDGPVPQELSLEALSEIRADFIISRGWGVADDIKNDFKARDNTLKSFTDYDKVILWFEHDLYDQLQILQILDWFHDNHNGYASLSIICVDKFLGPLSTEEMKALYEYEKPITSAHLVLAKKAWMAFRSNTPEAWRALLDIDTRVLPFLHGAIIRMLEEYPGDANGLSRTAQQGLQIISEGEKLAGKIFGRNQMLEERVYLGDSSFWFLLQEMLDSQPALLKLPDGKVLTLPPETDQIFSIQTAGLDVLAGRKNWLDITSLDRWIGGVHLTATNVWCWQSDTLSIEELKTKKFHKT